MTMTEKVGLVGLGNMGSALAERLASAFEVHGFDLDADRCQNASSLGLQTHASIEELAVEADIVLLSLPRPAISLDCIDRILAAWTSPGTIVETSTVTPVDARRAADRCAAAGSQLIDAAILSGVEPVRKGTTTLLLGGPDGAIETVRPVLDAITTNQQLMGDVGAGMAMKVINNAVAHAVFVVLSEALAMSRANGISIETFTRILSGADAGLLRPLNHRIGERVAQRDFDGGMPVEAARKDSVLALELAQSAALPMFATQAAHTVYELALAAGLERLDYAVVATLWDEWGAAH